MSKSQDKRIAIQKKSENFEEVWQWRGPHRVSKFQYHELIDKKWYHNTEDEDYIGPYDSEQEANDALYTYCKFLEIGDIQWVGGLDKV